MLKFIPNSLKVERAPRETKENLGKSWKEMDPHSIQVIDARIPKQSGKEGICMEAYKKQERVALVLEIKATIKGMSNVVSNSVSWSLLASINSNERIDPIFNSSPSQEEGLVLQKETHKNMEPMVLIEFLP